MDESNIPEWLKWAASAAAALGATAIYLRQYLSQAKVDRTADDANVATILRLQDELRQERERADRLMLDREKLVEELGRLRGEVQGLRDQVTMLTNLVRELGQAE